MAYDPSTKLYKCGVINCERRLTYFHMVGSNRPAHMWVDHMSLEELDGKKPPTGRKGSRICPDCEVVCRREEWRNFTQKEKDDNPGYASLEG
eukprot:2573115-Prorocentrum_lima.AAC.1